MRAALLVPGQLPPPDRDPDEVRGLARDILDHPRYAEPPRSLFDRFWDWVVERLADLFALLTQGGGGTVLAWVVLAAAVVGLVVALARTTGGLGGGRAATEAAEVMVELTRTPEQWRAEADRLAGQGRWAEALACRYRALVGELVAAGLIPDAPGRTAREYVADVTAVHPGAAAPFAEATGAFEATWYGGHPAGAAQVDDLAGLERATLDALAAGPPPADRAELVGAGAP